MSPPRKDGFYCSGCGLIQPLGVGLINCRRCGSIGLRCFAHLPLRIRCTVEGCDWRGWDDGVNDDRGRHMRRVHEAGAS